MRLWVRLSPQVFNRLIIKQDDRQISAEYSNRVTLLQPPPSSMTNIQTAAIEKILCYILSDIHLRVPIRYQNTTPKTHQEEENPLLHQEHHLLDFIERLQQEQHSNQELILILNGDILDINGSWFQTPTPWDDSREKTVEAHFHTVLQHILDHNQLIIQSLAKLLSHPNSQLIYIIGNHDYLFGQFPSGQERFIQALETLAPTHANIRQKIMFSHTYQNIDLKLYAEHGHVLDPFNHYLQPDIPPLGEVINVSVINQLPVNIKKTFQKNGYQLDNIQQLTHSLEEMEFLRPLTLFPIWIRLMAERFSSNSSKLPSASHIETLIQKTILATVHDQQVLDMMAEKLNVPSWLLKNTASLAIQFPWALQVTSYILSKLIRHDKANMDQYKKAQRLHHEQGYQFIAFGHTHKPSAKPIAETGYYFNTGSWTPVIQLSRRPDANPTLLDLDETFRRIEHSGVVRIYKDLSQPTQPVEYALETIRSGHMSSA